MAQQGEINQNQNVQGLFTEGSPLNFPAGATVRDENFILNIDGSRERRLGLGVEPNAQNNSVSYLGGETFVFDWNAVGNDGSKNYAAVYNSGRINFYDKASNPLSAGYIKSFSGFTAIGQEQIAASTINGDLVVVGISGGEVRVFYEENNDILEKSYSIKVRDIWGVDDPLAVDERSNSLTAAHAYNIANQGWKYAQARSVRDVGVTTAPVTNLDYGNTQTILEDDGGWPSNADVVTYGISETDTNDRFKQQLYSVTPFGTTPAPKGAAIVRLTNMTQDRYDFVVDRGYGAYANKAVYMDYSAAGPKSVASYAGRVFYAGFAKTGVQTNETYPNLTSTIVFSKSVESREDIYKCYQTQDPTTLEAEILASDGGTLTIAGSGFIHKLLAVGRSLLVFASEGVWEIYSTDQLFSASNYQVRKLTDVGCKSTRSIIVVESIPMYWTDYGIYALQPDQVSQSFVATNITAGTIQTYYDNIDAISVRDVFGFYDKFDKKARWLYSSDGDNPLVYDTELIFDSRLQSWYTNVYPVVSGKVISGMVSLNSYSEVIGTNNVIADQDNVLVGTNEVITDGNIPEKGKRSYKYIIKNTSTDDYEFHEFNRADFKDFGVQDAAAVMVTGPYTGGDTVRRKNSSYLIMQLRKTETGYVQVGTELQPVNPGSCLVEAKWDWTDLSTAGKFVNPLEMYRHNRHYIPTGISDGYDDGNPVITTKSRLRGSGRAVTLQISSSPEKDLNILGWTLQLTQNQKV